MKRLESGSVVSIPLIGNLGFAYAKYIDLLSMNTDSDFPDLIKVFNIRTIQEIINTDDLKNVDFLISPILPAGLRPTIKGGYWKIVGSMLLNDDDRKLPEFRRRLDDSSFLLVSNCDLNQTSVTTYSDVKSLNDYAGFGTGNIEIILSLYFLIKEKMNITSYINVEDENYKWLYDYVVSTPAIR